MGVEAMNFGDEELAKIGEYVRLHLLEWMPEREAAQAAGRAAVPFRSDRELDLLERMIRVEEELKNLGIRMDERFEAMDKRFDLMLNMMDERFEAVDKRFDLVLKMMEERFDAVDKRFEAVDKRFEAVDKRFEAVDKRFEDIQHYMDRRFSSLQWFMGTGFFLLATLLSVFHIL
jgi:hypothetical protein